MSQILCVDDDPNILDAYKRKLRKRFQIETAPGGPEALTLIGERMGRGETYAVIVSDMKMPEMDGIQFLKEVKKRSPDSVRIMLTGNADQQTAIAAVNEGNIFQFLTKPCPDEFFATTLENALKQYRLAQAEKELLEKTLNGSIKTFLDILSMMDPQSFSRSQKVKDYVGGFCQSFQIEQVWELELAAMLAEIGKVTIPPAVLQKDLAQDQMTVEERELLMQIPEIGHNLLVNIPRLESVAKIVLYRNKNYDGTGYPRDAMAGKDIPLAARALKVLYDLVKLENQYHGKQQALSEMAKYAGRYDPEILSAVSTGFENLQNPEKGEIREVMLEDLMPGQILSSDVINGDGVLILATGTVISPMLLQKIRNYAKLSSIQQPLRVTT